MCLKLTPFYFCKFKWIILIFLKLVLIVVAFSCLFHPKFFYQKTSWAKKKTIELENFTNLRISKCQELRINYCLVFRAPLYKIKSLKRRLFITGNFTNIFSDSRVSRDSSQFNWQGFNICTLYFVKLNYLWKTLFWKK